MTRYATIDLQSGYVWWVGEAKHNFHAVELSLKESGDDSPDLEIVEVTYFDDLDSGFTVYKVPEEFDVRDGQDQAEIDATRQHDFAGRFEIRETED